MIKEEYLAQLFNAVYDKCTLNVYDHAASVFTTQSEDFTHTKSMADQLVREKLARYTDEEHTVLELTNFGKYWMMNGGYGSFLKEGQSTKERNKDKDESKLIMLQKEKEELIEARLKLTRYRLVGFWLTILISSLGLLLSLYSLFLILNGKK